MLHLFSAGAFAAFFQVVLIDLALAGDNAVAVGMAAAGLPERQRRKAIVLGLGAAVVMLIGFALITTQLLRVVGLLLAGGLLLLWVGWRMWRDLRDHGEEHAEGEAALGDATGVDIAAKPRRRPKPTTLRTQNGRFRQCGLGAAISHGGGAESGLSLPAPGARTRTARALCNGKTLAFQAKDAGSIPAARSKIQSLDGVKT